jgi:DNA topoisomerase VI subunit B
MSQDQVGRVEVAAHGIRHTIALRVDRIRQEPCAEHQQEADPLVKTGTSVTVLEACLAAAAGPQFLQLVADYAFLNPHLTLTLEVPGRPPQTWTATNPQWKKWLPSDPTSIHWYKPDQFERLVCGYLAHDHDRGRDRPVRDLIIEFDGLTGSVKAKAILEATGLAHKRLTDLCTGGELNHERVAGLLEAMKRLAKPVKPPALGVVGKDHLAQRFAEVGIEPESFTYHKHLDTGSDGLPFVVETAFGWTPDKARRLVAGVNWSPGIGDPFKQLGDAGRSLSTVLSEQFASQNQPVAFLAHVACPRVQFTDRGKGAVVFDGTADNGEVWE